MKKLAIAFTLFAVPFGSGCLLSTGPGASQDLSSHGGHIEAGSDPALVVYNGSSDTICYVRISPHDDPNWGPDRLGATETIAPGADRGWRVGAGSWDVRLEDCSHEELDVWRGVAVVGQGTVFTHD
jgi:hypothetical protein